MTTTDYLIVAGYLVAITIFGSWFARFQKTTRDYFVTGRSVPWWAVSFTIVATETSTLSFIGVPASVCLGCNAESVLIPRPETLTRQIVEALLTRVSPWTGADVRAALLP